MRGKDYNRSEKEELAMFLKTIETERSIWRGIALNKLFVVDGKKDRGIGKTVSLKNIAEAIDVKVLVADKSKAKTLNDGHQTNVFLSQEEIVGYEEMKVLLDEDVDINKLKTYNNVKVIGGVYMVDSARYVTVKDVMALESV